MTVAACLRAIAFKYARLHILSQDCHFSHMQITLGTTIYYFATVLSYVTELTIAIDKYISLTTAVDLLHPMTCIHSVDAQTAEACFHPYASVI